MRRKMVLPRPCPKCKRLFGTIQLMYSFSIPPEIILRIGHYSSKLHKKTFDDGTKQNLEKEEKKTKTKSAERKWCSFRSKNTFIVNLTHKLEKKYYSGIYQHPPKTILLTLHEKQKLLNRVKYEGWRKKDNKSMYYLGRVQKNIDYWENFWHLQDSKS